MRRLASVDDLSSPRFRSFMSLVNTFAAGHGLRVHTNWSKIWEYPWTWRQLSGLRLDGLRVLDIGSEISPMPWFFASLGARVSMVETDGSHVARWQAIRDGQGFDVDWEIVPDAALPYASETFDLVTSYSVLEHVPEKDRAIDEAVRVLRPGGWLVLTFDVCEPARGMTFPEWNGAALDLESFDRLVWSRKDLEPVVLGSEWNLDDIDPFLAWHRTTAPHHNYVVGGAILRKRGAAAVAHRAHAAPIRAHQIDTGLGSGNTGDDAMFLAAHRALPDGIELSTEVHSLSRTSSLPRGVRYLPASDAVAVEASIATCDLALVVGDTPVMEDWGLEWPLRANAAKLDLCHRLRKPVHAVGVGVDRLGSDEGLRIFRDSYLPIASWSVRSAECRDALLAMGVPEARIVVGADWAWLDRSAPDPARAREILRAAGARGEGPRIGVNLVNELWRGAHDAKCAWARLLDRVAESHGAEIVFLCNESRSGDYFDAAAAEEVRSRMRAPAVVVSGTYHEPSEMISLVGEMAATISQRYHFTLFSVLADVYPVSIERGQKTASLRRELALPFVGGMESVDAPAIEREVASALSDPEPKLRPLRVARAHLQARAGNNFALVRAALERGGA